MENPPFFVKMIYGEIDLTIEQHDPYDPYVLFFHINSR